MEERVAKLEAHMDNVREDVKATRSTLVDVRERLAKLEEKVSHLPSKGFIVTAVTSSLALMAALVLFQGKLQALVGVH